MLATALPAAAYYGYSSSEVMLTFDGAVEAKWKGPLPTLDDLKKGSPAYKTAREKVEAQTDYLVGYFQAPSFTDRYKCATVPGEGGKRKRIGCPGTMGENIAYEIEFNGINPGEPVPPQAAPAAPGAPAQAAVPETWVRLSYKFKGPAVFRKRWFPLGQTRRAIQLKMPAAPERFLVGELATKDGRKKCVADTHYLDDEDFFYFWDPDKDGCPLKREQCDSMGKDVSCFQGLLTKTDGPRTGNPIKKRWPNYGKLYGDNFNGREIVITWFLGYIKDENLSLEQVETNDAAYKDFMSLREKLPAYGLKRIESQGLGAFRYNGRGRLMHDAKGKPVKGINFLDVYEKTATWRGKPVHLTVRIALSDTGFESKDRTFHIMFSQALPKSDFLIYDGHSGLGAALSTEIDKIDAVTWNPAKHQVFFFNGCSGTAYFPREYAKAKGKDRWGKTNLRILSSAMPTDTPYAVSNQLAFIGPMLKLETPDWQTLLKNMDDSLNGAENVLFGVSGEGEDEWTPESR